MIKERAEWDKQECEALENLKMTLETEKRKIEDELEGERALGLDKDALLERSKRREGELEEEVAALQADLDTLDSQLDRALKIQRESEEKNETLRMAFDQAADHLVRLESQQQEWVGREAELTELVAAAQQEILRRSARTSRVWFLNVSKTCRGQRNAWRSPLPIWKRSWAVKYETGW